MQDYVKYLKNVLGVSQVLKLDEALSPVSISAPAPMVSAASKITVWVENFNQFTVADHTLLNNMLAATKIPGADIKVEDLSLKGSVHSSVRSPIEFELVLNPTASDQTYSPQAMHTNKNLKAAAWTFLQQVMQKYKSLA